MTRSRTPDAETLACTVAGGYAVRWARSVARLRAREDQAADAPAPWLVDGFAGADLQRAALRGIPLRPPAVHLARAADEALDGGARVLLVEEDPGLLARLEEELRDTAERVRRVSHPSEAVPGEVALLEAPFASVAARVAAEIGDAPALVRLAPLSARSLPRAALRTMADLAGADLLLRVPGEDFARAGGFGGPLADYPPHLRRVVEGCSALLGDERHGWLLAWREAARAGGNDAALAGAVDSLRAMLEEGEEARTARAARLEGAGGGAVHLLLSTRRPEHVLELNGAVVDAGAPPAPAARRPRPAAAEAAPPQPSPATAASAPPAAPPATRTAPAEPELSDRTDSSDPAAGAARAPEPSMDGGDGAPLDLFASPEPADAAPPPPDLRPIANELHARHVGCTVPLRDLLRELGDEGLAPEQARDLLGLLKRERRAAYRSLDADGAEVGFIAAPAAPPPKPRKARAPVPGVLGLFDEHPDEPPADTPSAAPAGEVQAEPEPASPAEKPLRRTPGKREDPPAS